MEKINKNNDDSEIFFQQGFGIGPFQMMQEIGKGKFGKVFLGIHEETKEKVSIKQIEKSKNIDLNSIYSEINIHKKLFHPYICKMYYVIENFNYIFIVTEYCSKGELFKILTDVEERFEEPKACKLFSQILSALEYLHNNNIAHRDIKLENMLMDDNGDAKLIDFGLSKSFEGDIDFEDSPGSPFYSSPEVLLCRPHKGKLADIWSMGICLYTMVCADYPFYAEKIEDFVRKVIKDDIKFPDNIDISPLFKDLIVKLLEKNPKNRITMEQIKKHAWMHIIDFNFMKSPGIIVNKDIFPIDVDIIKEIAGNNKSKIRNIISDILLNKHNNNTLLYYLKVESIIKNNGDSISDIRPTSKLFLNYINKDDSKLEYYNNNINKKIDELTQYILNEFIKEEFKIREEIKNALNVSKAKSDNNQIIIKKKNNNNEEAQNLNTTKKVNKKLNRIRSKSFHFQEFQDFLKKGEEKIKQKEIKLDLINEYISPLLFIHDIIDGIITNVVKLKNKEERRQLIPVNSSSLNVLATKTAIMMKEMGTFTNIISFYNNKIEKYNFSICKKEELVINSINEAKEKTFSFELPKTRNKNLKNKNYEKTETKSYKTKKIDHISYKDYKKLNSINIDSKPINELKNKKYEKKRILTHLQRNKSENLSNILNNKFSKIKKDFKNKIEKSGILSKNKKKRSRSQENTKKQVYKLIPDEEINKFIKNKKSNYSEQKSLKKKKHLLYIGKDIKKEKKEKQNEIKSIYSLEDKKRILLSRRIKRTAMTSKNIDENLNINELLSENKTKKKYINSSVIEANSPKKNEKIGKTNRNFNLSQTNFYDRKTIYSTISNSGRKKEKENKDKVTIENSERKKNNGKKYLVLRNKKKDANKENNNEINKSTKLKNGKRNSTPNKIMEKTKKKDIKISNFTHKSIKTTFCKTGRNERNYLLEESTNNTSVKYQINKDKDIHFETIRTDSNNITNLFKKIVKGNNTNNKNGTNKNEIKTAKDDSIVRNIIIDIIGFNNINISNLKNQVKFACTIYINKKKLAFNLNLFIKEKNKNILTGKFIEGDIKNYEKLFTAIKEKLE